MEPGPRPPHERSWRHPSEIAAAERELHASGRQRSRTLVLATSLVGVVMIGIVALVGGVATSPLRSSTASISRSTSAQQRVPPDPRSTEPPIATPVFTGSVAVMIATQVPTSTPDHGSFPVTVSTTSRNSNNPVTGVVLAVSGGIALVRLSRTFEPLAIAPRNPASTTLPPGGGRLEPLCDGLEGSPSLNAEGELVGLCVQIGDTMTVATLPDLGPLSNG